MTYLPNRDYYLEVERGNVPGASLVTKFGSADVGTSLVPVTRDLSYETPTTATALEFVSSSANDTSAGTGAREVTVIGLNSSFAEVTQTVTTNGTTAVALGTDLTRLYRWYVSSSGVYATSSAGSHAGTLTIRESGGGTTWSSIATTPVALGQSEIGAFTIPAGKTGYILDQELLVDSNKTVDIFLFQRPNADDVTTPFSGVWRVIERYVGITDAVNISGRSPIGPFTGPCDIEYLGQVSTGDAEVSVTFNILLIDD